MAVKFEGTDYKKIKLEHMMEFIEEKDPDSRTEAVPVTHQLLFRVRGNSAGMHNLQCMISFRKYIRLYLPIHRRDFLSESQLPCRHRNQRVPLML